VVKPIKLHWAQSKPNFGDLLSPLIVECIAGRPVVYAKAKDCDLIAIGSLMQRLKEFPWSRRVHIWGTGFIEPQKSHKTRHYVHALRGPGSAAVLGLDSSTSALGDPALLVDRLRDGIAAPAKKFRLSIIPHYKDRKSAELERFLELNPSANVIDVFADPSEIITQIDSSALVLSSAMHGLIVADGLGVPNCRVKLSGELRGGDFKFADYYGALETEPETLPVQVITDRLLDQLIGQYARPRLEAVKKRLEASFPRDL